MMSIIITVLLLATAGAGDVDPAGRPLAPAAAVTNDSGSPLYVLLVLEPDASFTNTTDRTLRVLDARGLLALADLRAQEHADAIGRLEARLADLDRALAAYRTARSAEAEDSP